jgi:hypothetical protein
LETKAKMVQQNYTKPHLEQHATFVLVTGLSLPITTTDFGEPLGMNDFLEEQQ